ncbi:GNAT family N-acetyltransferase [Tissierella pigra]|uniref:GNAT family N-acetyltransferase n=1 Tax=Tissierella pigra TaxID=2607614 RepID=UPI001C117EB4|nr:GNAT family protein [Tissierella pigra]MBU5427919.1 GNAT family N-acetyltransferase [Tissierella pigra]
MNIRGKFVTLRAMEEEDQELLREMVNDPDIEKMVGGYSFPISKSQQNNWFNNNVNNQNNIRLIIETEEDGAVGFANIVNIDWKNRSAFHGIKIANKKFGSRGIGTDTVMAVMRYAFEELQLNRLDGTIIKYNEPSRKLYCDKCGWKVEGIKRKSVFKQNDYHDELIVGILKEEYEELIKLNNYWSN